MKRIRCVSAAIAVGGAALLGGCVAPGPYDAGAAYPYYADPVVVAPSLYVGAGYNGWGGYYGGYRYPYAGWPGYYGRAGYYGHPGYYGRSVYGYYGRPGYAGGGRYYGRR